MKGFIIKFLVGILLLNFNLIAQEKTGSIVGNVIDRSTQKPLPGVTIRILNTQLGAISDQEGNFKINNVPLGIQAVQFTSLGYETYVNSNVSVTSGRPVNMDVQLSQTTIELEGAEVKASYFVKKIETATSTQSLSSEEIRRAPGVQEDVVRATALLPGVNVTAAGRNDLIVRGGAPFENLFLVDNLEVSNINHFGSQGSTGGPLSIVNLDFVSNVEFSSGGFAANYGDKVSSLTNITLRNGNNEKFGGKVNLSATGFGLNVEGPVSDMGSYFFSVRRSYLDLLFNLAGFAFIPQYWDYQGKLHLKLDDSNIIDFISVSAVDEVKLNNEDRENILDNSQIAVPNQYQNFSGITWKHLLEKGFSTVTFGTDYTRFTTFQNDSNLTEIFRNDSKEGEFQLKTDFFYQFENQTELRVGNQVKFGAFLDYDILLPGYVRKDQFGVPQPFQTDTSFNAVKNGTYVNVTLPIGNHKLTAGGRMDYYSFTQDKLFFSPRMSFIYFVNPTSSFALSAGRYYQSPSYIWLIGGSEELNPIIADQVVLGYDHTPLQDLKVQVEVYYKWYQNYPARVYRPMAVLAPAGFDNIRSDIPYGLEPLNNKGIGFSRGAELFIQKKLSDIPVYGLFSLSYSETKFKSLDDEWRYGAFDSRWVMNLAAGWRINQLWEVSGKFRVATGVPTTPYIVSGEDAGSLDFSRYNQGGRLPLFHQLDVRVDKRWNWNNFTLITYLDIQNLYGRENPSGLTYNPVTKEQEYSTNIGILPSVGISLDF